MAFDFGRCRAMHRKGLLTLVGEAEKIVNSRPLTYLPLDSEESEALTPNHFLLGSSSGSKPLLDHDCTYPVRIKGSWELIQTQTNQFWRRWVIAYLPVITRRTKWFNETKPIELGNIVLIVDEKRRNKWLRGKVIEIRKGWDGRIRQAVVETSEGKFLRAVSKLAKLDIETNNFGTPTIDGENRELK